MKRKILGIPIALFIVGILFIGGVSATLLAYFGSIEQTVTVTQGLMVDGRDWDEPIIDAPLVTTSVESPTFVSVHYLENQASVEVIVDLVNECTPVDCELITTNYYETNLRTGTLTLSKKDTSWNEITGDVDDVIVNYSTNVVTRETKIDTIDGLSAGYTLIYYADEEFDDNGVRLATPGQAYKLVEDSIIPISPRDGNLKSGADYCAFDEYDHCRGIKLWAIRSADLSDNTITWSANWQSEYYFETDLLGWNHNNPLNPAIVSANTELDFVIVNDVPIGMNPDTPYTITTTVDLVE